MESDFYKGLAEAVRTAGDIDVIGVASPDYPTAVGFAGTQTLQTYLDGSKKMQCVFNVTGMADAADHGDLVGDLCTIGEDIVSNLASDAAGLECVKASVVSPPTASVYDGKTWMYMTQIRVNFILRKE